MAGPRKSFSNVVADAARRRVGVLAAIGVTFLPESYRRKYEVPDSQLLKLAAFTGFVQLWIFGLLYIAWFFAPSNRYMLLPILEHLVDPRKAVVAYMALEGFARFAAGAFAGEVVPSLPVVLAAKAFDYRRASRERKRAGPRVPDRVTRGDGKRCDWCVESWAPKKEWDTNPHVMIAYRDEFYEVAGRERRDPPRPHVYLLKRPPDWKLVVKPVPYDLAPDSRYSSGRQLG